MTAHPGVPIPNLGDTVIYRSKIDNGEGNDVLSVARVIRTRATTVPEVMKRWVEKPDAIPTTMGVVQPAPRPPGVVDELPDEFTVDLVIDGLGETYREYTVPFGLECGQWIWPAWPIGN